MTNKRHWIYLILITVALIGLGMLLGQMPAHAVSVTATAGINGSLDASTPSPATVSSGGTAAFKFNASANHYVASVIDTCGGAGYFNSSNSVSSYTYSIPNITATCTVSATFALVSTFSVTCSTNMSTTTDSDGDGFTDYQECYGIVLKDGTCICGSAGCPPTTGSPPTGGCTSFRPDTLNPNTPDVFVIMVPATATAQYSPYFPNLTNPPQNPLQYVSNSTSQGGLGITVHYISSNQTYTCGTKPPSSRCVTSSQQAVMVTESLDTSSINPLGFSNTGTPNGPDLATVYTQRINNFISTACGSAYGTSNCADTTGVFDTANKAGTCNGTGSNCALTYKYILHTINHEVAHVLGPLAPLYNANYGGYHYVTGTNVIMDQSVYYTSIGGKVTFYTGTTFTGTDQDGVKFHP